MTSKPSGSPLPRWHFRCQKFKNILGFYSYHYIVSIFTCELMIFVGNMSVSVVVLLRGFDDGSCRESRKGGL